MRASAEYRLAVAGNLVIKALAEIAGAAGATTRILKPREAFDGGPYGFAIHKRVILEPSSTFGDPYDRAFSGVALRAEGPGYHTFRVREILEQSAATDADIREGDVITAVNGTPASDLTLSAVVAMFEKPAAYTLTIQRGGETVTTVLTPRRMV